MNQIKTKQNKKIQNHKYTVSITLHKKINKMISGLVRNS